MSFDFFNYLMLRQQASQTHQQATRAEDQVWLLERRVAELELNSAAIWQLLHEHLGCSLEDFQRAVLDLQAHRAERPVTMQVPQTNCPVCGRASVNRHSPKCLYCGADMVAPSAPQPPADDEQA